MSRIFLGRPVHWLLALIVIIGGAALGQSRLHVIDFNQFIIVMLASVVVLLALVLKTSGGGVAVTRDPVPTPSEVEESDKT